MFALQNKEYLVKIIGSVILGAFFSQKTLPWDVWQRSCKDLYTQLTLFTVKIPLTSKYEVKNICKTLKAQGFNLYFIQFMGDIYCTLIFQRNLHGKQIEVSP